MRTALYLRVSSNEQSVDNQLPALQAYATGHGWDIVDIFRENESAWKAGHQKELARLLDGLRSGKCQYDILLVWSLDRLSREGAAGILNLISTFKIHGVKVISIQEPWSEAPGAVADLLYAVCGWVAQMESERRSERVKAGLARAVRNGSQLGRPVGSKDNGNRHKSGYHRRWAGKQSSANSGV